MIIFCFDRKLEIQLCAALSIGICQGTNLGFNHWKIFTHEGVHLGPLSCLVKWGMSLKFDRHANGDHDANFLETSLYMYTLPKCWQYNKASLGEFVPLEILVVSTRFNPESLAEISPIVYTVSTVHLTRRQHWGSWKTSPRTNDVLFVENGRGALALSAWFFQWSVQGFDKMLK